MCVVSWTKLKVILASEVLRFTDSFCFQDKTEFTHKVGFLCSYIPKRHSASNHWRYVNNLFVHTQLNYTFLLFFFFNHDEVQEVEMKAEITGNPMTAAVQLRHCRSSYKMGKLVTQRSREADFFN